MTLKHIAAVALTVISGTGLVACGNQEPDDRGADAIALCRGNGGVIAFDDEVVICRNQTSHQIE